ncbi:MAG: RBBP9/YdeN family alpha/beta hydrolase [Pseudomonadota bacterium]
MHVFESIDHGSARILTVPGLNGSGPLHWQSLWEQARADTWRAELGDWDRPERARWVAHLDSAIAELRAPVVLAAHSLGCIAVAWWAATATAAMRERVAGALMVAPPDLDRAGLAPELASFAPMPTAPLPFASILVASTNDPWMRFSRARAIAARWGSILVDAGARGHMNADSNIGWWRDGQVLVQRLIDLARTGARITELRAALQSTQIESAPPHDTGFPPGNR